MSGEWAGKNQPVLVDIKHCQQTYQRDHLVLDDVSIKVREGEIVGLLGRSGSGKSSLLKIIAGLNKPTAGEIDWCGAPLSGPPEGVAMVFQSFALFPWLTVLENVELGMEAMEIPVKVGRKRALDAIDLIGLDGFENAYPKELSGGMRQRVGLARALVASPKLLLMDEPFSALDVLTAETLRTDLIDLWIEGRLPIKSILIVTHNIEEAVLLCDRVLVLSSNPGRITSEISINLQHPRRRADLPFRQLVDHIYSIMTKRESSEPVVRARNGFPGIGLGMVLPELSTNQLSGLMEALMNAPFHGHADLPVLAENLQMSVGDLFSIGETLQLLRFASIVDGDIILTETGRSFVDAGNDARKQLFSAQLVKHVPIAALIKRVLDERPNHHAPGSRFLNELEDFMAEDAADSTLRTVISWARFGELFAYDEATAQFSMENPA
jgi:NitT/TauT family transport system ATP-binding protein